MLHATNAHFARIFNGCSTFLIAATGGAPAMCAPSWLAKCVGTFVCCMPCAPLAPPEDFHDAFPIFQETPGGHPKLCSSLPLQTTGHTHSFSPCGHACVYVHRSRVTEPRDRSTCQYRKCDATTKMCAWTEHGVLASWAHPRWPGRTAVATPGGFLHLLQKLRLKIQRLRRPSVRNCPLQHQPCDTHDGF